MHPPGTGPWLDWGCGQPRASRPAAGYPPKWGPHGGRRGSGTPRGRDVCMNPLHRAQVLAQGPNRHARWCMAPCYTPDPGAGCYCK